MPKVYPFKMNFTSGEISPKLLARTDLNQFKGGVETMTNFIPYPHGGCRFRPGFHYVNEVKDSSKVTRLVPFQFSREQAYVLEFGDSYIRFYMDNGIIVEDDTPSVQNSGFETAGGGGADIWANWVENAGDGALANETTDPYFGTNSAKITCGASNNTYITQASIVTLASTNYTLNLWTKGDGTTAGEYAIYDVSNSAYIKTRTTTGVTGSIWTKFSYDFATPAGCIQIRIELYPGSTDGDIAYFDQVTVDGYPYEVASPYQDTDIHQLQWTQSADYLYLAHPGYKPRTLTRSGHTNWTLANYAPTADPFGADASDDCPRTVTFHEERLVWAGTNNDPQKIWFSKSGDYNDMTTGTADDAAIIITIASDQVNVINWLVPSTALIVGTAGGEFKIKGGTDDIITPSSIQAKSVSTKGSLENYKAIRIANVIIFTQTAAKKVLELKYSFEEDSYVAQDLTLISEHITNDGISEVAYQQEPNSILWAVRDDGVLLSMTYERTQEVVAWAKHTIAGGNAEVESIAVIPSADGSKDELWAVLKLDVNGSTVRYVEYMDDTYFGMDHFITWSGSATDEFAGIEHLEDEDLTLVGDDALYPSEQVVTGKFTVDETAETMAAGIPFTGTIETLRPEVEMEGGHTYGFTKSWNKVKIMVYQSIGGQINGEELLLIDPDQLMGQAPIPYTGTLDVNIIGWDEEGQITIVQDDPFQLILLAITGSLTIGEEM